MSTAALVVLVDDDLSVRRALPRLLRSAGYETKVFASAQEALESEAVMNAGCLILDVHLQRTTGFELLERLRRQGFTAPVLFITAYDDDGTRDRARALGAVAYLRKPFDASALLDAVSAALHGGRLGGNNGGAP